MQYRQYSPTSMTNTILKVRESNALSELQLHSLDCQSKLSGRVSEDAVRLGPPPMFTQEEEKRHA